MDLRKHSKDKDSFCMRGHSALPTLAQERLWNLQQKCQRSLRKRWKTFEKDNEEWEWERTPKFRKGWKVFPNLFNLPTPHSSNSLGDCWRLQIKETLFPSLGHLWSLKSEQRFQSTTASYCYYYQTLRAGQFLSSLTFITYEIDSIRKNHRDESKTNRL